MSYSINCWFVMCYRKPTKLRKCVCVRRRKIWKLKESGSKDVFREKFTRIVKNESGRGGSVRGKWEVSRKGLLEAAKFD